MFQGKFNSDNSRNLVTYGILGLLRSISAVNEDFSKPFISLDFVILYQPLNIAFMLILINNTFQFLL